MRNWMLTPLIVAGLAGTSFNFRNPRIHHAVSHGVDNQAVLAGSVLSVRQLGPARQHAREIDVAVRHEGGPVPDELIAWISDRDEDQIAQAVAIPGSGWHVMTLSQSALPIAPMLWLEAGVGAERGRAAYALHA